MLDVKFEKETVLALLSVLMEVEKRPLSCLAIIKAVPESSRRDVPCSARCSHLSQMMKPGKRLLRHIQSPGLGRTPILSSTQERVPDQTEFPTLFAIRNPRTTGIQQELDDLICYREHFARSVNDLINFVPTSILDSSHPTRLTSSKTTQP